MSELPFPPQPINVTARPEPFACESPATHAGIIAHQWKALIDERDALLAEVARLRALMAACPGCEESRLIQLLEDAE